MESENIVFYKGKVKKNGLTGYDEKRVCSMSSS